MDVQLAIKLPINQGQTNGICNMAQNILITFNVTPLPDRINRRLVKLLLFLDNIFLYLAPISDTRDPFALPSSLAL